jgi:hypothetical protein
MLYSGTLKTLAVGILREVSRPPGPLPNRICEHALADGVPVLKAGDLNAKHVD